MSSCLGITHHWDDSLLLYDAGSIICLPSFNLMWKFPLTNCLSTVAATGCNENEADHLDRDQQPYPPSQKTKRMRTSFKHHQLRTMKSYFAINHNPDAKDLKQLAQKTGLTKRVLQVSHVHHWLRIYVLPSPWQWLALFPNHLEMDISSSAS